MRARLVAAALFLTALPSLALAQGAGRAPRQGNDGKPDKYPPTNDLPKYPSAVELQKYNPVALLIDQRKKVSLTDSQVTTLRPLQTKIYERNGDLVARYDSVQRLYNPLNANDVSSLKADSVRTRSLQQTVVMNAVFDTLMTRRQNDDGDALALITDEKQKKKAAELLDKQDENFAKLFPVSAVTRRGMGRRRPY
ncbi:MAG TPA: hypothetical protein VGI97_09610 [Gemmatimonadaceae bacterium]